MFKKLINFFKLKLVTPIISLALCLVLVFTMGAPAKTAEAETETVRQVNADVAQTLSLEEKKQRMLSGFDEYSYDFDEETGTASFKAAKQISAGALSGIDTLGTFDEALTQEYEGYFTAEDNSFTVTVSYTQGAEEIASYTNTVYPYYVAETDDYVFEYDGTLISIRQELEDEVIDNCVATEAIVIGAGIVLVIVFIATNPQVRTSVASLLASLIAWFSNLFNGSSAATDVEIKEISVNVKGNDYVLERIEAAFKNDKYPEKKYYLAAVKGGSAFISVLPISYEIAVYILTTSDPVQIAGTDELIYLSTYTMASADARLAAQAALLRRDKIYAEPTYHDAHHELKNGSSKTGVFFAHYHPCKNDNNDDKDENGNRTPHSFFGQPVIHT